MCVDGELVFWSGSGHRVVDTRCWEESYSRYVVDVVDSNGGVEEIGVVAVKVCVCFWDLWLWSGDEEEVNVDGDDEVLDCGEHHGEVGEIWVESPCVSETVFVYLEREIWELEVVAHAVE